MAVKRILIAGGAGYIGSHAAKAVRLAGHEPVVLDDLTSGHEHAVRWGPLVRADIRNPEAVRAAIREYRPEAVMQFAARIEVGEGEKNPAHFYDNNVAGTLNLVRVMLEEGVKNLVFSSTCAIYGDPEKLPLTEDLPKRPVSVYGRTKLEGEEAARDLHGNPLIVRTAWVYAAKGANFVATMLRLMRERSELGVVADQIGTPTHVPTLARTIWTLAQGGHTGTFHATDAGVASWYDFAVAIHEEALALGLLTTPVTVKPIRTSDYPTPARRPAYSVLDKTSTWALTGIPNHWRVELRACLQELARG